MSRAGGLRAALFIYPTRYERKKMKIPARHGHILFGALLSAIMVTVISGTVVLITQGYDTNFFSHWFKGFATAWPIAFPTVLFVAPFVRKVVAKVTV
jgi:hypothetical protein